MGMKTTAEIKTALKAVREIAASKGLMVVVTRSRRGIEPSVIIGTCRADQRVFSIDDAIAFLAVAA